MRDHETCASGSDCDGGICLDTTLTFRFPDTDSEFSGNADDDLTFTGPAAIAVTPTTASDLPLELATSRCADLPGAIACVDELYAQNGSCETGSVHIDPIFGHFTALPPANDFEAICTPAQNECDGAARNLRFTVDASGNALIPMDWRGILLRPDGIPVARIVSGNTNFPAFSSGGPEFLSAPRCLGGARTGANMPNPKRSCQNTTYRWC